MSTRIHRTITERFADGPDMFHFTHTPVLDPNHRIGVTNVSLGHKHDAELYKVRNSPHLYEGWHVDMVMDQREQYLDTLGDVFDWDCHKCKHAVITDSSLKDAACPNCGKQG